MSQLVSTGLLNLPRKPHALYRFFDRTDALLYVGITLDFPTRMSSHRKEKPWWTLVDHITIEHFDNRLDAIAAERTAIKAENPLYNVEHNEMAEAPVLALDAARAEGQRDLAYELMDRLADERVKASAWASVRRTPRDEMYSGDPVVEAALAAIWEAQERLCRLEDSLRDLVDALPRDEVRRYWSTARADVIDHLGPNFDEFEVMCWAAHVAAKDIRARRPSDGSAA